MKYNPFNKELSTLEESDLNQLIENEIGEGWYIEYKKEIPQKTSKLDNLKIAKSISSFANTNGGWIFWGIECDNKNKPIAIEGVNLIQYKNFEDQISQLTNSNINPNPIYHFKNIQLSNNKNVFVIQVEASPTPPYITSQGIIYQRENNESKPIKDRYIIERLKEKADNYFDSIEEFSKFDLGISKGESDSDRPFLELYLFPLPFNSFRFKEFESSEFFKSTAIRFYQNVDCSFDIEGKSTTISLNLNFNSIFSSEGSLIIRSLNENNLIYRTMTVEIFENGNLKFYTPIFEFDTNNIPKHYKDSLLIKHLLDKYSPLEETSNYSPTLGRSLPNLPPIKSRKESDFSRWVKLIDGMEIMLTMLIIFSKFQAVLKDNDFNETIDFGLRVRIADCWRRFIFLDNEDYLEKIKLYNIPLSPKGEIEIPKFSRGNAYIINLFENGIFIKVAKYIMAGIGLPDLHTIKFGEIINKGIERFKIEHGG